METDTYQETDISRHPNICTDRQTDRWRDILSSTLPDIKTSRGTSKTSRHQDIWKDLQTDRYQYNHPDTQPNRKRDNKKSRQTDINSTHPGSRTDRVRNPDRHTSRTKASRQKDNQSDSNNPDGWT